MNDLRCIATPISWLRLELHHAGELPSQERDEIAAHLASCAACAACLAQIEAEASVPLPALVVPPRPARVSLLRRIGPPLAALALAAALLLFVLRLPRPGPRQPELDPNSASTKGGDVTLTLVRDDGSESNGEYRDGDRWKAVVSCPPSLRASWDVVVYEAGAAAFPLPPAALGDVPCGNAVALPGAFRTTGHAPMTVCIVWRDASAGGGALVDRSALRGGAPSGRPDAICKDLKPVF